MGMAELNDELNERGLEPFPQMMERAVALRAVGLTKIYPAVSGAAARGDVELFRGLGMAVRGGGMGAGGGGGGAGERVELRPPGGPGKRPGGVGRGGGGGACGVW